jgi:hypothetical protein
MALICTRLCSALASGAVLAPERYDPRRSLRGGGLPLGEVARLERALVRPGAPGPFLILDTTHAREGRVDAPPPPADALQSAKRIVTPGDVIVSRLRPYLRQVAFLDEQIPGARGARLVASSEFYVLRPRDGASLAFLVPFLLSTRVQRALAAAQEGGHHPRFREEVLAALPVPPALLEGRERLSALVEASIRNFRTGEGAMGEALAAAERAVAGREAP